MMHAKLTTAFLLLLCLTTIGKGQMPDDVNNPRPGAGKAKFDLFDWELAKAMGISNRDLENVVVSPISLKVVLATLLDGANGTTADEISKGLGLDKLDRQSMRQSYAEILKSLRVATPLLVSDVETRIFAHHTANLNKNFLKVLKDSYGTDIEKVDFSQLSKVIKKINNWAEGVTHGHIKDLISEDDTDRNAVMLLLNVIFFNGLWQLPFAENETKLEPFYLNERQHIGVPMMKAQHQLEYVQSYDYNIQLVRLPYMDGTFAMYIILPGNRSGINDLIAKITPARVHTLMKGMQLTNVDLSIPKFDFSYSIGIKPVLQNLGIKTMFTTAADFSNMEDANSLYVSNIVQKSGIEINEKGSTAYASTVVDIYNKFGGEDPTEKFIANRPFIFFIEEDKTRTVVFVGKVTNPSADTPPAAALPPSVEANLGTSLLQGGLKPVDRNKEDQFSHEWERMSYFDTELLDEVGYKALGNVVISPASIKSVLGLLLRGASGKSAIELQNTLRLPENADSAQEKLHFIQKTIKNNASPSIMLKSANAIFLTSELKPKEDYRQYAMNNYYAPIHTVHFNYPLTASRTINTWVNNETNGFIPSIISPGTLKPESVIVVVNAMYFKGNWLNKFPPEETKVRPFYKTLNQVQYTYMMQITGNFKHSYVPSLQAQVIQLPFEDNQYVLVIVLPKKKDGIYQVMRDLKHNSLLNILSQQEDFEVILQLPRFTVEYETDVVDCLRDMRTREIFSDNAHLKNIAEGNKKLKVSNIIHKAKIEVNEDGATAGAATGAAVVPLMSPLQATFSADHPFLFFIYNSRDKIILFEGRVNEPKEATKAEYDQSTQKQQAEEQPILNRINPELDIRVNDKPLKSGPVPNFTPAASEQYQPSVYVTQRSTGPINRVYPTAPHQPTQNTVVGIQQPTNVPGYVQYNVMPGVNQQVVYSASSSSASSSNHHSSSSETKTSHSSSVTTFTRYPGTNTVHKFQQTNSTDPDQIRFSQ